MPIALQKFECDLQTSYKLSYYSHLIAQGWC
jgi:hypothetical protein